MHLRQQLIAVVTATALAPLSGALAAVTTDAHVTQIDHRPLTNETLVHFTKANGSNITPDSGCDVYWVSIPATDQYFKSALLTAQSRNAEVYLDVRYVQGSGTPGKCEVFRFITYE